MGVSTTALNYGCQYVKTKLVFIVDSDDTLTDDVNFNNSANI